jgi:hypothetical protein
VTFTDDELLAALLEGTASSRYGYVSVADYTAWRKSQPTRSLSTVHQITGRFSGWTNAEALAGIGLGEPRMPSSPPSTAPTTAAFIRRLSLLDLR